jgi:hypothetical protein
MKTITFKAMGSQIFIAMDTEDPIIAERALMVRKLGTITEPVSADQ